MKAKNKGSNHIGRKAQYQFINNDNGREYYQSYGAIIVEVVKSHITLDRYKWNYNQTVEKHRNLFLGETTQETLNNIKIGKYSLTDLNI